jgi:hypothetical protein
MTPEQTRIVNTTIHKYVRQEEDAVMRNRKLLALLKARGRVTFNNSGDLVDWKVRYKRAPVQGFAENDVLTFTQRDRWKTAQIEWRGYATTDSITKKQKLMNKSTEAIVKIYEGITEHLMEDIEEEFGTELYTNGYAAGNSKKIHGIESFMANSGAAAAGFIGQPSSTYAGISCVLGNYGGNWSQNGSSQVIWPTGIGDAHYDFWSPLIIDYTNTSWQAGTKTWPNTCNEALRYGIIKGKKNKSARSRTDVVVMNDELYRQFLDAQGTKERINFQRTDTQKATLLSLGYSDTFNYEGTEMTYEYGVSDNIAYGWCMDYVELMSLQGQLFVPEGPDFSISTQSWRFSIDFYGNLKFRNLRYFTKWMKIS